MIKDKEKIINDIENSGKETIDDSKWELVSSSQLNTHCDLQDCHSNCNCYKTYESCKTYNWSGWKTKTNTYKNCGHQKKSYKGE